MKSLKLDHHLADLVVRGEQSSTCRLFDDKDIAINDDVQLIDKVDPHDRSSWKTIGFATIRKIIQKRLGDIVDADMEGYERLGSTEEVLARYQKYYGQAVTSQTPVKIIHFTFTPYTHGAEARGSALYTDKVVIYADGGSRGNPGPSASGYVLYDEQGAVLVNKGSYLGITTNNQAEYTALKLALEEAKRLDAKEISVYMDSMLVINQMKGIFKVKNRDLWPIHNVIQDLSKQFKQVRYTQVPRELNKLADATVNQILDDHLASVGAKPQS